MCRCIFKRDFFAPEYVSKPLIILSALVFVCPFSLSEQSLMDRLIALEKRTMSSQDKERLAMLKEIKVKAHLHLRCDFVYLGFKECSV